MINNTHLGKLKIGAAKILGFFYVLVLLSLSSCTKSHHLFNTDNGNWTVRGNAQWNFTELKLEGICDDSEGFVMTKDPYDDFELFLEFFPDSTINSGVFVRCQNFELSAADCHEMNIWDLHPNQEFRTGAIVTKSKPLTRVNTLNRWNTYRIKCMDKMVKVWVNDTLTAKFEDVDLNTGYIGLQASGNGKITFRNIELKGL